jgi:ribosomal protein L14E/L6E/L27E
VTTTAAVKTWLEAKPGAVGEPFSARRGSAPIAVMYKVMDKLFAILSARDDEYVILKCDPTLATMCPPRRPAATNARSTQTLMLRPTGESRDRAKKRHWARHQVSRKLAAARALGASAANRVIRVPVGRRNTRAN